MYFVRVLDKKTVRTINLENVEQIVESDSSVLIYTVGDDRPIRLEGEAAKFISSLAYNHAAQIQPEAVL